MSRDEARGPEWLRQQIDELGALRNASIRDPQFKAWRQNTLTYIQRIWPGDSTKSERFRRVPFSPPSTRHDARTGREYYERGCGEALEYLHTLLALVEQGGAPSAPPVERHPESFEGDFPEIDLGGTATPPAAAPTGAAPPAALDQLPGEGMDLGDFVAAADEAAKRRGKGPQKLPESAGRPDVLGASGDFLASAAFLDPEAASPGNLPPLRPVKSDAEAPVTPAAPPAVAPPAAATPPAATTPPATATPQAASATPPASAPSGASPSRISVRGETKPAPSEGARPNPLKDILAPVHKEAAQAKPKNGKKKKPKLKDMLGLASLEHDAGESSRTEEAAPAAPQNAEASPSPSVVAEETEAAGAAPDAELDPRPAIATDAGSWSLPEFLTPAELPLPLTAADVEPHPAPSASPASRIEEIPAAFAAADEADPFAPPAAADEDAGHAARVTAEFLDQSAVLSSTPRAVHRGTVSARPETSTTRARDHDSVASRVLAIAAEVDALGVPEGHRARARAALMDLARQLDEDEIAWEVLRDAIHLVMEFPPLARRTLPLLLPFLDRAA